MKMSNRFANTIRAVKYGLVSIVGVVAFMMAYHESQVSPVPNLISQVQQAQDDAPVVKVGMNKRQLVNSWGEPDRVKTVETQTGRTETFKYARPYLKASVTLKYSIQVLDKDRNPNPNFEPEIIEAEDVESALDEWYHSTPLASIVADTDYVSHKEPEHEMLVVSAEDDVFSIEETITTTTTYTYLFRVTAVQS
jgi:hypothetical protein